MCFANRNSYYFFRLYIYIVVLILLLCYVILTVYLTRRKYAHSLNILSLSLSFKMFHIEPRNLEVQVQFISSTLLNYYIDVIIISAKTHQLTLLNVHVSCRKIASNVKVVPLWVMVLKVVDQMVSTLYIPALDGSGVRTARNVNALMT